MRKIKALLLIFFFVMTACSPKEGQDATVWIIKARQHVKSRDYNSAVIAYKNAIDLEPKNDTAYFELAETYILLKKIETGIRYYEETVKVNPDNLMARLRLTQIYLKTDRLFDARMQVSHVLSKAPDNISAYHLLSSIQIRERDLTAAIETLKKSLEYNDGVEKTHLSLAKLYLKTGQIDKAEDAFKKAVSIAPSFRDAYMGLVNLYNAQRKWKASEDLFHQILEKADEKAMIYRDAAIFYENHGRIKNAENYFVKAEDEATGPKKAEMSVERLKFYTRHGEKASALETIDAILSMERLPPAVLTDCAAIYLQYKLISEAEALITRVLKRFPNYSDALVQKGKIQIMRKDFVSALNTFDRAIELNQLNAEAYYLRAICIQNSGGTNDSEQKLMRAAAGYLDDPQDFEKEQVEKNLLAAIMIDPSMLEPRFLLTEIYLLEKDKEKAMEQMTHILRMAPKKKKSIDLLIGLKLLEGDADAAEELLLAIANKYPEDFPAHVRLGFLYRSQGKKEEALSFFQKAFAIDPSQTGIIKLIVELLKEEKRYDEALSWVNENMPKSDTTAQALLNSIHGEIVLADGNLDKALTLFETAVQHNPKDLKSHMAIARIHEKKEEPQKAIQAYLEVEKIKSDYLPALMAIGLNYEKLGNLTGAEQYYRKVLAFDPKHAFAANNLAYILSKREDKLDEALELAQMAKQQQPDNADILDTLGWLYYKKGNFYLAVLELEDSLKLKQDNPLAYFHMGMSLYRIRKFEESRKYFTKALELDQHFEGADIARNLVN